MAGQARPVGHRRPSLEELDAAILLAEDLVERTEALRGRLTAAGRVGDAAYAWALLELGRSRLVLLRRARRGLLARGRPRAADAFGTLLVDVLRGRGSRGAREGDAGSALPARSGSPSASRARPSRKRHLQP